MALTEKQYRQIQEEMDSCKKPLIFFHDDPDGLCSFLMLYKYMGEGKGVIIKTTPKVDEKFVKSVQEYAPDKIFIVDIAMVDQEFIEAVDVPIIWIDHHAPLKRENVKYFNPRVEKEDDNFPASYLCYKATGNDLWLAAIGCVGDWTFPEFMAEFSEKYPDLLPSDIINPDDALFKTKLGTLIKIFSFVLTGYTKDAMKYVKILTRINSPYEILNQENGGGKFVLKRYEKMDIEYQKLLKRALSTNKESSNFFVFTYTGDTSFTKDLANEILYRSKRHKFIVIGREKAGEIKMSIRARGQNIPVGLQKALEGIEGYGGGHEYACGACVKHKDFPAFIDNMKKEFVEKT